MGKSKEKILAKCNAMTKHTLMETLQIEYIDLGEDYLIGKMPVNPSVHQPDGVLHGGAMVALAESVGSAAAHILLDGQKMIVRGIEISANHIKSVKSGEVLARAALVHRGRTTQLWDIKITAQGDLVSSCKLTTISLPRT